MTEHIEIPGARLGRRPASDKPTLKARHFLKAIPQVPTQVDYLQGFAYDMGRNDQYGTCGPTSLANYVRLVTAALDGAVVEPSWQDIRTLYVRQNPAFDERTGVGDDGVEMKTMLSDAIKHGFTENVQVLGFAEVDVNDPEEIQAAVAIFGGVLLGLDLSQAQNQQLPVGKWDLVEGSPSWGGHAVMEGAYSTSESEDCVTWGKRVEMTRPFLVRQRAEAYVVILSTHLGSRQFMQGWDLQRFAQAFTEITGRPFPVDVPAVTPEVPEEPEGQDPDDALADAVREWAHGRRRGVARQVAIAIKKWLQATGRA